MKIFEGSESSWPSKVNFVDINDVFVGYDTAQDCCEDAGWFIAEKIEAYAYSDDYSQRADHDIEPYVFDTTFFAEVGSKDLDSGGQVAFKLVADGKPDLYLNIFNSHNGYYGHGFEVKHSGHVVREGVL